MSERSSYAMNNTASRKPMKTLLTDKNYAQLTADLYDRIATWYVRSFWTDATDADWIEACISASTGRRVADIGSGPGNYARDFVDAGHEVTCIDISAEMIRSAAEMLPAAVGVVSDMRTLPFATASFDTVFCAYSLNHILRQDLDGTLREFARIMHTDGVMCLLLKLGSDTYEFSSSSHPSTRGLMCLFEPNEIQCALRKLGIQPILVRYKKDTSASEFQHEKMLLIGRRQAA